MSPLHIQRMMEPQLLFANPRKVQQALVSKYLYGAASKGIWDETLIPGFYDVLQWGLDAAEESNLTETLV